MRRELLIAAGPGEWRAVWLEEGIAVELHVERGDRAPPDAAILGRVVLVMPGLDAALVDIGEVNKGFLPGRRPPEEGARVIVAVQREAQRGKGARLSTRIAEERLPGLTERTARLTPPAWLEPAPGFAASLALRLPGVPETILCDEAGPLAELRRVFPSADITQRNAADWPVDVEMLFAAALAPKVEMANTGSMHIIEAEAATLIDVDTGNPQDASAARAALKVNLAAAAVIARHIRLRQIGGGIVVDFAALDGRRSRQTVQQAMTAALAADPAQPQVLGWSRLGHLEMVRPRRLRPLSDAMLDPGVERKNAATLAFEALRLLAREARANPATNWRLVVTEDVAMALAWPAAAGLRSLEDRLGRKIAIEARRDDLAPGFDIAPL
jgi:Ribonuclease G/E